MTKVILGLKADGSRVVLSGAEPDAGKVRAEFSTLKLSGSYPAGIVRIELVSLDRGVEEHGIPFVRAKVEPAPVVKSETKKGKT